MSKNSVNFGSSGGVVGRGGSEAKDKMYEPKHKQKLVRVLTVIAYVFSVSLAAIMLSLFYVFIYNPEKAASPKGHVLTVNSTHTDHNRHDSELTMAINSSVLVREEPRALPIKTVTGAPEAVAAVKTTADSQWLADGNEESAPKSKFSSILKLLSGS